MSCKKISAKFLERTSDSIPWEAADRQLVPIYLERYGYEEAEYQYSGQANIYSLKNEQAEVKYADVPYTNRFLLRKPRNAEKFSGNVVIELLNPSNSWDVSPMWCQVWPSMLEDGDIYIGVTIRAVCAASLKKYNLKRYKELNWGNPNPAPVSQKILMWQHCSEDTEFGLVWDMLTQLGSFFKEEAGQEIVGSPVKKVYAMSCSQSSMFLSTYFNTFHESDRKSPISPPFDGYLTYTGSTMVPLNQSEDPVEPTADIQKTRNCPVPIIRFMSQWDFRDFAGHISHRRKDSDEKGDRFRLYEIGGHAHNAFSGALYRPGYEEIAAIEKKTGFPATDFAPLDIDSVMRQALRNLKLWSEENIAPPHAQNLIAVDEDGHELFDENGNCKGGLRLPQLTVPIARYYSGTAKNPQDSAYVPFSEERLLKLYPTHTDYVKKMFAAIDEMLFQNFISVQDADRMKKEAVMAPIPKLDKSV
ncbi:MAG: alpha/beta hydrolase domain-containing protein [Hespellia sp.]|nr:alpha/beta hydrolase domain-containing protein [Hespellia sp.]